MRLGTPTRRAREAGAGKTWTAPRAPKLRFSYALVILCAVVSVLVAVDYWTNAGRIYRGVEVGEVDLGGKTPAEAEKVLKDLTAGGGIRLAGPGGSSVAAEEIGVEYDVAATVDNAYAVGREGNLLERLSDRLQAAFGTVAVSPEADYRAGEVRSRLEALASRLDREPKDARVEIRGSDVYVVRSSEGYKVDVAGTTERVEEAVEQPSREAKVIGEVSKPEVTTAEAEKAAEKARRAMSGPLTLRYQEQEWTADPAQIGTALGVEEKDGAIEVTLVKGGLGRYLGGMYEELTVEPKDAGFAFAGDGVKVTPGKTGRRIEDAKLFDALKTGIFDGKRIYEVPVVEDEPKLTTARAEKLKPTEMLGSYKTNYLTYDDDPGRVENLKIASDAVSGTALAPGEVFSFNELASPLDYYDTKVIVRGRVDTAEGGGLCQVSSTLYMAVNLAGLDVVEREPHYAELPYIRPGFDATVWFGAIDMKFKNTTDGYVLVRERVDEDSGNVYAEVWGRPNGTQVEMRSEKVAEYDDEKGNPVTKWVTYQKVTKNGKVVFDDVLHKDTYKYLKPAEEDAPYDERPVN